MPIWKKNLFILWISQFLTMAGMSAIVPFLPLFIRELGVTDLNATASWSGLVFAGPFIVSFFLMPAWGALGDKYGRKLMALRAIFGLGAAQILVSLSQDVYQLLFFRILQGALSGFNPAAIALVASNTPEKKTGYALGMLQSATTSGTIIGPLIGGVLSDIVGFRNVFVIVGSLISLTGLLVLLFVKETDKEERKEARKFSTIENWKHILTTPKLRRAAVMIMLATLGAAVVRPIFVLYVETFDINKNFLPTITGGLYGILGLFSTISAAVFGRYIDKKGICSKLMLASGLTAVMYILHTFITDIYLLIPVRVLLGLGYGIMLPLLFTWISSIVSNERKGGILGVASSFQILGTMTGSVTAGAVVGFAGLRYTFSIAGVLFILIFAAALYRMRND